VNELLQTCYDILGLSENASREEVVQAFDTLRKRYEENRAGNRELDSAGSWERLKEITWARDTLLDYIQNHESSAIREEGPATASEGRKMAGTDRPHGGNAGEPVNAGRSSLRSFAALVVVALFLLGLLYFYSAGHDRQQPGLMTKERLPSGVPAEMETRGTTSPASDSTRANDTARLLQEVKKAVVTLRFSSALGSGFLVTPDGYIVTNGHVVASPKGIAQFSSGETADVDLVKFEPDKDFALLKTASYNSFPFLKLGDSDVCREGDTVFAIGSPRGLESTITKGIVSAKDRKLPQFGFKLIQTDAAINQGNSGGPLINTAGQVIGINTMTIDKRLAEGLNFAIAINEVKALIADGQRLTGTERAREVARLEAKLADQARKREMSEEDTEREEQRQHAEYQERADNLRQRLETMQKKEVLIRCLMEVGKDAEEVWNEQCRLSGLQSRCKLPMRIADPLNIRSVKAQTECLDRNPQ
jgi:S1-C subfamily serine protease